MNRKALALFGKSPITPTSVLRCVRVPREPLYPGGIKLGVLGYLCAIGTPSQLDIMIIRIWEIASGGPVFPRGRAYFQYCVSFVPEIVTEARCGSVKFKEARGTEQLW
jgi:hypothetical protein